MAQQINLFTPVMLRPSLVLSARRMAWALLGLSTLLAALCGGLMAWHLSQAQAHDELAARQLQEKQQLTAALHQARERVDPVLLAKQADHLRLEVLLLNQRAAQQSHLQLPAGQRHSSWLELLAHSTPTAVWITRLRLAPGQVELSGRTLDPAALRVWMASLAQASAVPSPHWEGVQVQQVGAALPAGSTTPLWPTEGPPPNGLPVWQFHIATPANSTNAQLPTGGTP